MGKLKDNANPTPEAVEASLKLVKAMASENLEEAAPAMKSLAQTLTPVLKQAVFDESTIDGIYRRIDLPPGADARFPLDIFTPGSEDNFVAYTMPKQGRIPERHVEADELYIATYRIANAIDWSIDLVRDARWDIVARAMEGLRAGVTKKLNDDGWHVILAAANAGGFMIRDTAAGAGVFTPALVNKMRTTQKRRTRNGRLTDLYVSPEACEDIRNWATTADFVGEAFKERVFTAADDPAVLRIGPTNIHELRELGEGTGGTAEEYQDYFVTTLSGSLGGSDVELVLGLDLSKRDSSFLMPVREDFAITMTGAPGSEMHRSGRQGAYGVGRLGFSCVDLRACIAGSF